MIILKEKSKKQDVMREGITNFDKAIIQFAYGRVEDLLQDQYNHNVQTARSMMDTRHFAFSQTCGALAGVIANLAHIHNPPSDIESLIVSLQKIKDAVKRELSRI
jgi:hypothetical protein